MKKRLLQFNATSKHNDIQLMSLRNYINFLFNFQRILMHKCKSHKGFQQTHVEYLDQEAICKLTIMFLYIYLVSFSKNKAFDVHHHQMACIECNMIIVLKHND